MDRQSKAGIFDNVKIIMYNVQRLVCALHNPSFPMFVKTLFI